MEGRGLNAALCLFSRQQGRSETEEYSSDSESESEDEEELQMILEDLQKQNEELEVRANITIISLKSCLSINGHLPLICLHLHRTKTPT